MTEPKTVFVSSAPRLAIDVLGAGPLVLCLHGIGGHRDNWAAQLPAIADAGFTATAVDMRGYGDSDDYSGRLRFGDFSDDILRVLDHFGHESVHLVGLSMGGRISLDFFRRHPEKVASLCLADTSAGSERTSSPEEVEKFLAARKKPLLEGKTPADIAPNVAARLAGPEISASAMNQLVHSIARLHTESYLKTLDTVTKFTDFPDFSDVDAKTLVIVGEHDTVATPEHAQRMADEMPNAELAVIPGAGHLSNIEQPDRFNVALGSFLIRHRRDDD